MFPKSRPSNVDIADGGRGGHTNADTRWQGGVGGHPNADIRWQGGRGGVKNGLKYADVILARSLMAGDSIFSVLTSFLNASIPPALYFLHEG